MILGDGFGTASNLLDITQGIAPVKRSLVGTKDEIPIRTINQEVKEGCV